MLSRVDFMALSAPWRQSFKVAELELLPRGFLLFQGSNKVINLHRRHGQGLHGSFTAESGRQSGYRLITGGFEDTDKVVLAQQGILSQDFDPHILHLFVDFLKAVRVLVGDFPPGVGETGEHDIDRHHDLLLNGAL